MRNDRIRGNYMRGNYCFSHPITYYRAQRSLSILRQVIQDSTFNFYFNNTSISAPSTMQQEKLFKLKCFWRNYEYTYKHKLAVPTFCLIRFHFTDPISPFHSSLATPSPLALFLGSFSVFLINEHDFFLSNFCRW